MNRKGFTLVELLVVLLIIGILAAIAAPLFLQHSKRAKASEAVATLSLIRQAEREFKLNKGIYQDVASDKIQHPFPTVAPNADGSLGTGNISGSDGMNVDAATAKYFSNAAYVVKAVDHPSSGDSTKFADPPAVDFTIFVNGANSVPCAGSLTNCATSKSDVTNYRLEMDNSGRIFVTYDITASPVVWEAY